MSVSFIIRKSSLISNLYLFVPEIKVGKYPFPESIVKEALGSIFSRRTRFENHYGPTPRPLVMPVWLIFSSEALCLDPYLFIHPLEG